MEIFSGWSERKLRKSQIKILYQNQLATQYLTSHLQQLDDGGLPISPDILESLVFFDDIIANAIVDLTVDTVLSEHQSAEQLQINAGLKNLYSGHLEGRRRARSFTGSSTEDLQEFADRFRPAAGWDNISDREWDRMISMATNRAV